MSVLKPATHFSGRPTAVKPIPPAPAAVWLACVRRERDLPLSHDNDFHSVLGMLKLDSADYNPGLDIFAPCSDKQHAKHPASPEIADTRGQGQTRRSAVPALALALPPSSPAG